MNDNLEYSNIEEFLEKVPTQIEVTHGEYGDDEIRFCFNDGTSYRMFHWQDCCESVTIEDICGDIQKLIGKPLLQAEEASNRRESEWGTSTWTFYKFATHDNYVTIRWYGKSNGYYSESVDIEKIGG